jgi:hypothetical protein
MRKLETELAHASLALLDARDEIMRLHKQLQRRDQALDAARAQLAERCQQRAEDET